MAIFYCHYLFYFQFKVVAFVTAKEQIILSDAGSFAEQILFSIKTVMAFGGQSLEWERYLSSKNESERE